MMVRRITLATALVAFVLAFGSQAGAVDFSTTVTLSELTGSSKPGVASAGDKVYVAWLVDTQDPQTMQATRQLRFRRSTDGGVTFQSIQVLDSILDNVIVSGPTAVYVEVAVAAFGDNVYVAFTKSFPPPPGGDPFGQILFRRSTDGGVSFSETSAIFMVGPPASLTVDMAVGSTGIIHVVTGDAAKDIFYLRSTNGGMSFETPVNLSNTGSFFISTNPAVAAAGTQVGVVWSEPDQTPGSTAHKIHFTQSTNSGLNFSTPLNLSDTLVNPFGLFPAIAMGDAIHVVWKENDRLAYRTSSNGTSFTGLTFLSGAQGGTPDERVLVPDITASGATVSVVWTAEDQSVVPAAFRGAFFRRSNDGGATFDTSQNLAQPGGLGFIPAIAGNPVKVAWEQTTQQNQFQVLFRRELPVVNKPPTASGDGPYLGVAGIAVRMDASASSDPEGAALTFKWNFGDGSTLITISAVIEHTYASAGAFPVTLLVFDGALDSTAFTTTASIGASGGGQRDDVDAFLSYVTPSERTTTLPAGTTSFNVTIIYGPTIIPATFQAFLNGAAFTNFKPVANTSQTVAIPLASGRNVLLLQVDGVRSDGQVATDRDRLTFVVP